MRILMAVHSLRRGGAERVLLEIALGLRNRGHVVEILSWLDVDEYREGRYDSVPRHFLIAKKEYRWPWSVPNAAKSLRRVVEQFRPEVIEIHTPTIAWVTAWANVNIPCVHVLHGYGSITRKESIKDKVVRVLDRLVHRRLKANVIVVSSSMVEVTAAHISVKQSRFVCVPNGIDLHRFKFREKTLDSSLSILMLGTLSPNKGQALGIRAFQALVDNIPSARLMIVGDGDDRTALEELVKVSGLEGRVDFLGRREDVPDILSAAHILWQLSESEGLPMVVLEAMAVGLPVVGFNVRGTRDAVAHERTGYLVPYGGVEAVARRTVELLTDGTIYRSFSVNARHRVEKFFDLENMVDGHERAIYSVTQGFFE